MSYMLSDLKKNYHALMFKVLKSMYIFKSRNRFIIFDFKQVQSHLYSRRHIV